MLVFLLRSTVDKSNNEQDFSIVHKPVIISQYAIVSKLLYEEICQSAQPI